MLIWQGVGAYAFAIPFFVWLATSLASQSVLGQSWAVAYGREIGGLALLISAGLVYWLDKRLARRPTRTLVDKETGEEVVLGERHTMFFVPMRYWAYGYAIVGAILIALGLLNP